MGTNCPLFLEDCPLCGGSKPVEPRIVRDLRFHLDRARKAFPVKDSALVVLLGSVAYQEYLKFLVSGSRSSFSALERLNGQITFDGVQVCPLGYHTRQISVVMSISGEV